jgi:deazaflavin-dependent oxidoreductase (nitroreductase family)
VPRGTKSPCRCRERGTGSVPGPTTPERPPPWPSPLTSTAPPTGQPRRSCLIYGTSGEDFVVVASKGGDDDDPAWFKNLKAEPSVGVQVGTRRFTARARVASSGERAALWAQMVRIFPLYDEYAHKTERVIPIVLLTPQEIPDGQ